MCLACLVCRCVEDFFGEHGVHLLVEIRVEIHVCRVDSLMFDEVAVLKKLSVLGGQPAATAEWTGRVNEVLSGWRRDVDE